ncbi:MAG: succinate dehydrogenase cytochrome b subunit [Acidobacteria bacterium]|nr:succinate dehydrogenase cytochrome b subunit [Acidobacteriota bacterium]MBI3472631.1 succinate dehydrogenase cytochrome b subunit [Candidatus Solibacter usitatus]
MSPAAAAQFYAAPIGKKVIVAVTGFILFGFVLGHLLGNLQVYAGPDKINAYAEFLHHNLGLLWGARLVLLASVALHITASLQLNALNNRARPVGYQRREAVESSYASRTMIWSGPIIGAFVVYHLLHFTFGAVHPDFKDLNPYHNMVAGFRQLPVSLAYVVAMVLLGQHLYHGAWSMFQTLGVSHPRYTPLLKRFAAVAAALLVAGNISIPISILLGMVS